MRQAKLHVTSVLSQKAEAACARGEGRPRAQLSRTGGRKPGVRADPQVNARKGKGTEQASHEVRAQGRKADIVPEAPLSHSASNGTFHLTAPRVRQGRLLPARGSRRPSRHAGRGGEAADGTEGIGVLPRGLKGTLLRGKTQEHPRPCQIRSLCPSLPDAARPHASLLHWVGTFPKPRCFSLVSFLSRHLEPPPAGSCHPSGWLGPGPRAVAHCLWN